MGWSPQDHKYIFKFEFQNNKPYPLTVIFEPWGSVYSMAIGETILFTYGYNIQDKAPMLIEFGKGDDDEYVIVWLNRDGVYDVHNEQGIKIGP